MIGFTIAPLQQYYIGQESFKFQTVSTAGLRDGTDVYDHFSSDKSGNNQFSIALLRSELASTSTHDFQPDLWQEGTLNCSANVSSNFEVPEECYHGGTTFENVNSLFGIYIAQLPSGYQTGLMTQFMPRMNSSISYTEVSEAEFPPNCDTIPGAYYTDFIYNETVLNLKVCMPNDLNYSPWKSTRDRQDISETMFLHAGYGIHYPGNPVTSAPNPANATFKLVVNTTLGYFELPNYNNSGIAGPLLAIDPFGTCINNTDQCSSQSQSKRSLLVNESNFEVSRINNQGPLTMVALALFDPGSFIASQFNQTAIQPSSVFLADNLRPVIPCTVPPLILLLGNGSLGGHSFCDQRPSNADDGYASISSWLQTFYSINEMHNALLAGVIIASRLWLRNPSAGFSGNLMVQYDLGADSVRPKISATGIIVLSILEAIDLILLLGVAAYISFSYTWTKQFDASAMMRQGAARADEFPLHIISSHGKERNVRMLEQMPGWVGDAKPDDDVGLLAIGAETPLRPGRRYLGR